MKRTLLAALIASAAVAGCYSLEDIRQGPIVWTAAYDAQFDTMANCLAGLYGREYSVVPQLYQRDQRANVVLAMPRGAAIIAEFQIKQVDKARVEVSWKHIGSPVSGDRPVDRLSKERADRCARSV